MLGHEQLQNGVAEKFETLIIKMVALGFVPETRMRERFREQKRVPKFVADSLLEWIHATSNLAGIGHFFQRANVHTNTRPTAHSGLGSRGTMNMRR